MNQDELDAIAKLDSISKSANAAREDLAKMRGLFTSRRFLRAASTGQMRENLTEMFDTMDMVLGAVVDLAAGLVVDQPEDEADLAI